MITRRCNRSIRGSWPGRLLVLSALIVALVLSAATAEAHGDDGRVVLENAPLGPYQLTAWIWLPQLRPGEVHLAMVINDEGSPAVDCQVQVGVSPLDGQGSVPKAQAGPASVLTGYRHEAALTLPGYGRYRFIIDVRDGEGRGGQQSFDVVVPPVSSWVSALIYGQLAMAPFIALWLAIEGVNIWRRRAEL